MPPAHERDTVSREIFDFYASHTTKMLEDHEKDSIDHEKRILAIEAESKASKALWGLFGGIFSTVLVEGAKFLLHK